MSARLDFWQIDGLNAAMKHSQYTSVSLLEKGLLTGACVVHGLFPKSFPTSMWYPGILLTCSSCPDVSEVKRDHTFAWYFDKGPPVDVLYRS